MQRRWGILLGEDLDAPQPPGQEGDGREAQLAETHRALEGDTDPTMEWARRAREEQENGDGEDDDFWLPESEGELSSTLAIVALCAVLAYVSSFCPTA